MEEKSIGKFIDRQRERQGLRVGEFPGRFFARGPGASPTLQPIASLEIEVRDTVWQVLDIACVPVFRCIVMSGGGDTGVRTHEKGGAKKGPVKVLRVRRWAITHY